MYKSRFIIDIHVGVGFHTFFFLVDGNQSLGNFKGQTTFIEEGQKLNVLESFYECDEQKISHFFWLNFVIF